MYPTIDFYFDDLSGTRENRVKRTHDDDNSDVAL